MKFEIIDKHAYEELNCNSVFDNSHNEFNRKFGKITVSCSYAKIAWSSDLLLPQFFKISNKIYTIGVDQNFAIYDFEEKRRIMFFNLMFLFYEMVEFGIYILVATELEIVMVDIQKYKIIDIIPLPDTYKKIEINGNIIKIYCLNDRFIKYQISNNNPLAELI